MTIVTVRFSKEEADMLIGAAAAALHEALFPISKFTLEQRRALSSALHKIGDLKSDVEYIGSVRCAKWPDRDFVS